MKLSYKWLKEFVDIDLKPRELSEALTMSGSKVESYVVESENISNVVIGKILDIEKHPDAEKLVVCKVDVDLGEPLQIVTGANNLKVGDIVPVAKDNSLLPNGTKIKKGKLRGVVSEGMLCSLDELCLTKNDFPNAVEDGIFVLDFEAEIGQNAAEAIGIDDTVFEFEITSNRPDCFSVIGLARETAATFKKELKLKAPKIKGGNGDMNGMLEVSVESPELCPAYIAKVVKNVRIAPSPKWLRERLRALGVRPINNIVDITNYVMLEYGQPMHAFDLRLVEDGKIVVRRAKNGEKITTLDGVDRELNSENLVIADTKKPIAIAGVMGGEFSGITDDTATVVFESANFNGTSVRLTAKSQGMRTDSSSRFEKGLDPNSCLPALERACELVELLDAGDVLDGTVQSCAFENVERKIPFDPQWINKFVSIDMGREDMIDVLKRLDIKVDGDFAIPPSFRPDLGHKADISEEIARFYGYNLVKSEGIKGTAQGKFSEKQLYNRRLSQIMLSMGMNEIITYSFISPKEYNKILMPTDDVKRTSVTITNPLGEDTSIMRTTALPSMLLTLARNYNNRNSDVRIFELAKEYEYTGKDTLPNEKEVLIGGIYGEEADFFVCKGILEKALQKSGIENYEIFAPEDNSLYAYHPGRSAVVTVGGGIIGEIGEVHPEVLDNYDIGTRAYVFSVSIEKLFQNASLKASYKPLPKYPSVNRDLALICSAELPVGDLHKAISRGAGKILEDVRIFDIYQGSQIEAGKKSVAFKIVLRSAEATLTEEQINASVKKILKQLSAIGAELRL